MLNVLLITENIKPTTTIMSYISKMSMFSKASARRLLLVIGISATDQPMKSHVY